MKIYVNNRQTYLKVFFQQVRRIVKASLALEQEKCDEVAIHFVQEKKICELHAEFFNDPTTTDCITFPMDDETCEGYRVLGEVFINPKAAIEFAKKDESDPYRELTLYIVHGMLHLLGYDDIKSVDRVKMRRAEKRHLDYLSSHQLLLTGTF